MNRILVIRGGAIGDFVLTLPAIKLLRDAYPHARLEILGYQHIAALAERRFYAEAIRSIEYGALARFFAKGAELPRDLVGYFSSFDLVVSYLFDPDNIFEQNLTRCGVETFLACSPKIHEGEHATVQLARPLEQLGLILADRSATLYPSAADREFACKFYPTKRTIALHPGSGSESKNWPLKNWTALVETVLRARAGATLLIVGGEADGKQLASLRANFSERVCFAENLDLPRLAAVLQRTATFLGHDSGISHIAAAVGTPALLLFGPSDPAVWAPVNGNVRVLRVTSANLADLPLNEVTAALDAFLSEHARTTRTEEELKS